MSQRKPRIRSRHYLVTNPYLFPISFAQRITAEDLEMIRAYSSPICPLEDTHFAYAPYSQKLQRQLRSDREYSRHRFDFRKHMQAG